MNRPSRTDDLALLRALVAAPLDETREHGLTEDERKSFREMVSRLEAPKSAFTPGTGRVLTPKQRQWAEDVATRRGISWERDNADVPVGAPVPTPEVLRNLPKAPPGRRTA